MISIYCKLAHALYWCQGKCSKMLNFLIFIFIRHILASLHFNENVKRKRMKLKSGKSYINVTYPKFKMGDEVLRVVAEPPTYGMSVIPVLSFKNI